MNFNCNEFRVSIYGDGDREYDGYFLVVFDEFDECANPTMRKKALYVESKSNSIEEVYEFVKHLIRTDLLKAFRNYERLTVRKIWEVTTD